MRADHHGGSRIRSAVQECEAQNVVVHVNHRVGPCDRPDSALSLQHEVDVGHARPDPRATDSGAVVADLERRHSGGAADAGGGLDERVRECSVDGGLKKSVLIDGADFGPAVAVAIDGEERGVDRDWAVVDSDGVDLDEVLGGGLTLRERRRRAHGVDEQRRESERRGGVEGFGDVEEVVRAVAEEYDAVGRSG